MTGLQSTFLALMNKLDLSYVVKWDLKCSMTDLIWVPSLSVCMYVYPSVCMYVCHTLVIFHDFANINLSYMAKFILLDSLLQEVTTGEIQIATSLRGPSLYFLIFFSKRLQWGLFMYVVL